MELPLPPVGELIYDWRELRALPVGTTLEVADDGRDYGEKLEDGLWRLEGRGNFNDERLAFGDANLRVKSYPEDANPMTLTRERFLWRFRDRVLQGGERSGVNVQAINRSCERLGVGPDTLPFVVGQRITNNFDRSRLPIGSQIFVGGVGPYNQFGVFEQRRRGTWDHVLGGCLAMSASRTVVLRVGESNYEQGWMDPSVTEAVDPDWITAFKVQAWMVGDKAKAEQSWCGTYEAVMRTLSITENSQREFSVNGMRVGDTVSASRAARLPQGSILSYQSEGVWAWYIRDDSSTNRARTRLLCGRRGGSPVTSNYSTSMQVLTIPVGEGPQSGLNLVFTEEQWECFPPGTMVAYQAGSGDWVKAHDGRINTGRTPLRQGNYQFRDFSGIERLRIRSFPPEFTAPRPISIDPATAEEPF